MSTESPGADSSAPARRVLVVDDNEDAAESLAALLRIFGHDVAVALDGEQALATAAAFEPGLVLLDLGMPRMNGLEVARRLRETEHGGTMVIVALSGHGDASDVQRSLAAGFDAHHVKPISLEDLQRVVGLERR